MVGQLSRLPRVKPIPPLRAHHAITQLNVNTQYLRTKAQEAALASRFLHHQAMNYNEMKLLLHTRRDKEVAGEYGGHGNNNEQNGPSLVAQQRARVAHKLGLGGQRKRCEARSTI